MTIRVVGGFAFPGTAGMGTGIAAFAATTGIGPFALPNSLPTIHVADVPAPATPLLALLGLGAMGVQGYRRRRDEGLKRLAEEQDAA